MSSLFQSILSQLEEKISKKNTDNKHIAFIISTIINTPITADQITVHNTTLHINAPATIKMALMLNKEKVLTALRDSEINVTLLQ